MVVIIRYYDIFVRHALGSYRDILKEVSYSVLMADYLSFKQNKAFAHDGNYPDENYAREIMQLFTIGLYKLKDNGLPETDANGVPIDSYV